MRVGVITGSGGYDWPFADEARKAVVATEYGEVAVDVLPRLQELPPVGFVHRFDP